MTRIVPEFCEFGIQPEDKEWISSHVDQPLNLGFVRLLCSGGTLSCTVIAICTDIEIGGNTNVNKPYFVLN